jgi:hypothetical protein
MDREKMRIVLTDKKGQKSNKQEKNTYNKKDKQIER